MVGWGAARGATEAIARRFFYFLRDVPRGMLGFEAISDHGIISEIIRRGIGNRPSWNRKSSVATPGGTRVGANGWRCGQNLTIENAWKV